eukprot:m.159869 g.159869  ORF g.159869 m.159869 type:complete len:73 (+) comp15159_c0_seq14:3610-3828(+)
MLASISGRGLAAGPTPPPRMASISATEWNSCIRSITNITVRNLKSPCYELVARVGAYACYITTTTCTAMLNC